MLQWGMGRRQGRVSRLFILAGLLMGFGVSAAFSESLDTESLASCVFKHAEQTDKDMLKKLIVMALSDDVNVGAVRGLGLITVAGFVRIAMEPCKVDLEQLTQPELTKALRLYGEKVGSQVIEEVLAKAK